MGDRAAARPALPGPVLLDVAHRRAGLVADEGGQALEHLRAALVGGQVGPRGVRRAADEAEEDADRAVGRRVVEDRARGPDIGDALPAEPGVAPERPVVDGLGLGQGPRHERLQQRRLALGQRRRVGQAGRERRRHREDHVARLDGGGAGDDAHAVVVLGHHADRRLQRDPLAQAVGDLLADDLRAAHEAVLLRAAAGGDEAQERARGLRVAGRRGVLQRVEQRQLLGVGAPDRLAGGDEDGLALGAGHLRAHPVVQGHCVPRLRLLGLPGCAHAHLLGEGVELGRGDDRLLDVGVVGQAGDRRVQRAHAAGEQDVGAGVEGGEGLDAHGARQGEDAVLRRADVLAADLRDVPAAERRVERAPADAVARLEHDDGAVGGDESAGGGQAGEPGADHAHVGPPRAPARGGGSGGGTQGEERRTGGSGPDELAASESVVHGGRA
jgi:hypothetical protein